MNNPVVASDGHTYERGWIDRHIKTAEDKRVECPSQKICSPTTNNPLPNLFFVDNESAITLMKNEIAKMRQMNDAPKH